MKNSKAIWTRSIFWGLVLVGVAVVLIMDGVGFTLGAGIGLWHILGGIILVSLIIERLVKGKLAYIFFPLAFLFILFEAPLANALGRGEDLISNWTVLLAAALLTGGMAILIPRRDKESGAVTRGHMGNTTLYFDAADLSDCRITGKLGRTLVYFTNKEAYNGDGVISVSDNVGQITLYIPDEWNVVTTGGDNLGRIHVPPQTGSSGKTITLSVSDNLGVVDVLFC